MDLEKLTENGTERREYVNSLERGLAVIKAFSREKPDMTLTEVAKATNISRAAARRFLLTLESLGYVGSNERGEFFLKPAVLSLGYAYLSSLSFADVALPHMEALTELTKESCSAGVLDGQEVVYVARVPTKRIMTISLSLGSRLPVYATSMGRMLLGNLNPAELDQYFCNADLKALTKYTITNPSQLCAIVTESRQAGYNMVDQELEIGLRSIAAPVVNRRGQIIAAVNVSTHVSRVSLEKIQEEFLPLLLETAAKISAELPQR